MISEKYRRLRIVNEVQSFIIIWLEIFKVLYMKFTPSCYMTTCWFDVFPQRFRRACSLPVWCYEFFNESFFLDYIEDFTESFFEMYITN
jgi:hypothetical protein